MMVIPIDGATHIYGDSMCVINNTSETEFILKKKNNTVYNHTVCESVAMDVPLPVHRDGDDDPTDLLTKVLCRQKRKYLINNILHNVYDGEFKPYTVTK